jgi:hypothetical protein
MPVSLNVKLTLAAVLCAGVLAVSGAFADPAGGPEEQGTRRFGLFIGSNNGGRGRVMLRYAVSDARAVSRVFGDMGGIAGEDNILLVEPNLRDINRQITNLASRIGDVKPQYKRTELVFYYSGHSDEDGLLLGRERYSYADLRQTINRISSDMRIVILDSCSSGAFTRAKGGVKTQPFLIDSSISAEGYAFLTSSSATEASQESDTIESSYFTHSLVAGLRGAADTVGDRRVTLNEVYQFAYAETLARTEMSIYGAQHPSYDMQISGTGDVVLTDIRETSASLLIDENIIGRLSIRDSSDYLVAEITKVSQKPMELGLEPGLYRITLQRGDNFYRAEVFMAGDSRTPVTQNDFRLISAAPGTARGESSGDKDTAWADDIRRDAEKYSPGDSASKTSARDEETNLVNVQVIAGKNILGGNKETDNILLGIFTAAGRNLEGVGVASISLASAGYVRGLQAAGIFNNAGPGLYGFQAAGIFNMIHGNVEGFQAAGIFNATGGSVEGLQAAGIFNATGGNVEGFQAAGIFNAAGGSVEGFQAGGIFNIARGGVSGLQAGLVNIDGERAGFDGQVYVPATVQIGLINVSRNENTVSLGLVNIIKNGILHPAVYYDSANFMNFSFRSGSKYFYSLLSMGTQRITTADSLYVSRGGFGVELPLGKVFLDLDVTCGTILDPDVSRDASPPSRPETGWDQNREEWKQYYREQHKFFWAGTSILAELRVSAGFKVFEHLGAFAGVSYTYLYQGSDTSPNPDPAWLGGSWDKGANIHKVGVFAGVQF